MSIDNNKLIKALAKLSPEEINEILSNQQKSQLFREAIEAEDNINKQQPLPRTRWRDQQKNVIAFLEKRYKEESDWWDGWVVDFDFNLENPDVDCLVMTLKKVDGEQKIINIFFNADDIPF